MNLFKKTDKPLSQEEITEWLRELRGHPFNAASGFDVTAVFRVKVGEEDTYYFPGVNVENIDHRLGTHAEEGCIAAMATAFGKGAEIVEGWVMGAPKELKKGDQHFLADNMVTCCGKCRQQIAGLADPSVTIHSISLNGEHKQKTVGELLPDVFSFRQFAPELLNASPRQGQTLSEFEIERKIIREGEELSEKEIVQWLQELESIDYATKTQQAVVLKLTNNIYVAGVKVEEAAYVDIDPIQSALTIACASQKQVCVEEVWTFSQNRNKAEALSTSKVGLEKELTPLFAGFKSFNKEDETFTPLTLSSVQFLAQFAAHGKIPIHMVNAKGQTESIPLNESANLILTLPCLDRKEPIAPLKNAMGL